MRRMFDKKELGVNIDFNKPYAIATFQDDGSNFYLLNKELTKGIYLAIVDSYIVFFTFDPIMYDLFFHIRSTCFYIVDRENPTSRMFSLSISSSSEIYIENIEEEVSVNGKIPNINIYKII